MVSGPGLNPDAIAITESSEPTTTIVSDQVTPTTETTTPIVAKAESQAQEVPIRSSSLYIELPTGGFVCQPPSQPESAPASQVRPKPKKSARTQTKQQCAEKPASVKTPPSTSESDLVAQIAKIQEEFNALIENFPEEANDPNDAQTQALKQIMTSNIQFLIDYLQNTHASPINQGSPLPQPPPDNAHSPTPRSIAAASS